MTFKVGSAAALLLLVLAVPTASRAGSDPLSGLMTDWAKSLELSDFCAKHHGHPRCKSLEERQAYCATHPMDVDHCDLPVAGKLLADCDSQKETDRAFCAGTLDAMLTNGSAPQLGITIKLAEPEPTLLCVPVGINENPEQLRILFVREAYRHPEVLHFSARRLLFYALAKEYPCPNPLKDIPR